MKRTFEHIAASPEKCKDYVLQTYTYKEKRTKAILWGNFLGLICIIPYLIKNSCIQR